MRLMDESYPNGKEIEMDDHIDWLRELGQIYEEAHDVIQYINLRHLEIERLQRENEELRKAVSGAQSIIAALKAQSTAPMAWRTTLSGLVEYVTDSRYRKFSPAIQAYYEPYHCANCITKAQSTDPVAWVDSRKLEEIKDFDITAYGRGGFDYAVPLYTAPPTATALVDDFKRRAVEVCSEDPYAIGKHLTEAIESLPLIGEKR